MTVLELSDAEYFAYPALSHSDLKLLQRTPAYYRWTKTTGNREHKSEYDFGHVVHELVLGTGAGIDVIDAEDWRTKAAQQARIESREAGRAPLLRHEYERAQQCATAVTTHPVAAKLLATSTHREIALVWEHDGIQCKAKLDAVAGRFGVDLKTTDDASTDAFGRSAAKYGYATQAAFYTTGMRQALQIDDPAFLFIVVEKDPPHLVNVVQLDSYDVDLGDRRNRALMAVYRRCLESGEWPAYGTGINVAQLPRWAEIEMETE